MGVKCNLYSCEGGFNHSKLYLYAFSFYHLPKRWVIIIKKGENMDLYTCMYGANDIFIVGYLGILMMPMLMLCWSWRWYLCKYLILKISQASSSRIFKFLVNYLYDRHIWKRNLKLKSYEREKHESSLGHVSMSDQGLVKVGE